MPKQNESRDEIMNTWCRMTKDFECKDCLYPRIEWCTKVRNQILNLFKRVAHECVPKFVMEVNDGVKKVLGLTHKNIDKWGKG